MIILIVYDISDNKTRGELADYLKTKGFVRVQKSFFIGRPRTNTLLDIERTLHKFIRSDNDVIHVIPVPETIVKNIKVYGKPLTDLTTSKELVVIA